MYRVYCDDTLIYHTRLEDNHYTIYDGKLSLELNKAGTFNFTIHPNHPKFDILNRLKSIITVYQKDYLIFRGRILNSTEGFYNEKQVSCEGELAFLCDSIQRPYDFYTGSKHTTISELFAFFIQNHNEQVDESKQFKVGNITVTDENDYITRSDSEYSVTWDAINKKLVDSFGGYLWVRHEEDGNYIDYLSDFTTVSNQPIKFGKNLLDLEREVKGEEIATALIPLGAKLSQNSTERVGIAEINGGVDYVYNAEAVAKYGWIFKTKTWDNVTQASNLLRKANEALADLINLSTSIEVKAADLSDVEDFNAFHLGTYVTTDSSPHGLDSDFLVTKLQITLAKPSSNKLTLGSTFKTFTEQANSINKNIENVKSEILDETDKKLDSAIVQVRTEAQSVIDQNSKEILLKVGETQRALDSTNSTVSSMQTTITQDKKSVEMQFDTVNKNIGDVSKGTDAKFTEISNYIRFENGEIELGGRDSDFKQRMTQTKNSFYDSGVEVAYIGNKKMYIMDGEFTNSLQIGAFAYIPGEKKNLKFKKVVK